MIRPVVWVISQNEVRNSSWVRQAYPFADEDSCWRLGSCDWRSDCRRSGLRVIGDVDFEGSVTLAVRTEQFILARCSVLCGSLSDVDMNRSAFLVYISAFLVASPQILIFEAAHLQLLSIPPMLIFTVNSRFSTSESDDCIAYYVPIDWLIEYLHLFSEKNLTSILWKPFDSPLPSHPTLHHFLRPTPAAATMVL